MKSTRIERQRGATLLEMCLGMAIFTVTSLGLYSAIELGESQVAASQERLITESLSVGPLAEIRDLLLETSPLYVDTTFRYYSRDLDIRYASDRFSVSGMSQCSSPTCGFHTHADLSPIEENRAFSTIHMHEDYGTYVRGKVLPQGFATCPYDDSPIWDGAQMDAVRIISPRDADGTFPTDANGRATWPTLQFIVPWADDDGTCNLGLYRIHVSDLVAGGITSSAGWSRWTPDAPTMIDLMDFGLDGTDNGEPDGRVSSTIEDCDGDYELFYWGLQNSNPTIVYEKRLNTWGEALFRRFRVVIRLDTGATFVVVEHVENGESWNVETSFTRAPRILASGVTEFFCSTAASSPYDAADNPTGVEAASSVRVGLGTSRSAVRRGVRTWFHDAKTILLAPRN